MWAKVLLLFFVFSFLFKTDTSFDQDLGRHLKLGEIILQSRTIPNTNLFSYTNPNFSFINTHWLFEVWVYITSQALGLEILLVIKIIIFLISIWLVLKIIPKENTALLLPIGFIFLHVLRERTELRPEIFSFLFTAGTYYILEKYYQTKQYSSNHKSFVASFKPIFLLPLIQLIWINTHIYFFIGFILQAIFFISIMYQYLRFHMESGKTKLLGVILTLSILISLINPNGLAGLFYPLNVTKNYGYTIVENQTMFLLESINFKDVNFLFVKICLAAAFFSLIIILITRKFNIKNILLIVTGASLALLNVRSFPYLVFISFPAILQSFSLIKIKGAAKIFLVFTTGILLLESFYYLNGSYYSLRDDYDQSTLKLVESGKQALDFVINNDLPNPIYNNFDIGSYIIYRGYPKYQVFVDGRPEGYPAKFFSEEYIPSQSDYQKFKTLEKKIAFKTIIFSHTDQTPWGKTFLSSVIKDPEWQIIYIDNFMIVLTKKDVAEAKQLQTIDLAKLNASNFTFDNSRSYLNLGLFLLNNNFQQPSQTFFTAALKINPQSPAANTFLEYFTGQFSFRKQNIVFW